MSAGKYNTKPAKYWDQFYSWNENNFFKDRKWLHNEFPELLEATRANVCWRSRRSSSLPHNVALQAGSRRIVEVGCGAGNTVFPLLRLNENPQLEIFACDYSAKAVEVVRVGSFSRYNPGADFLMSG
jgi:tRNAThr (cytosine32-N3)-methyltransferase